MEERHGDITPPELEGGGPPVTERGEAPLSAPHSGPAATDSVQNVLFFKRPFARLDLPENGMVE
jgi:hypothetical protein